MNCTEKQEESIKDKDALQYKGTCINNNNRPSKGQLIKLFRTMSGADILPVNENAGAVTHQFLKQVVNICLDFIHKSNDRNEPVLEFHQPSELLKLYDFSIPAEGLDIEQLLKDCSECLKYQVKTGESFDTFILILANGIEFLVSKKTLSRCRSPDEKF